MRKLCKHTIGKYDEHHDKFSYQIKTKMIEKFLSGRKNKNIEQLIVYQYEDGIVKDVSLELLHNDVCCQTVELQT
jgi:hypothetical protein